MNISSARSRSVTKTSLLTRRDDLSGPVLPRKPSDMAAGPLSGVI